MHEFTRALWSQIPILQMVEVINEFIWPANDHMVSYKPIANSAIP